MSSLGGSVSGLLSVLVEVWVRYWFEMFADNLDNEDAGKENYSVSGCP